MGGNQSTPQPPSKPSPPTPPSRPPPSPPFLSRPWRTSPAMDPKYLLELKARVENFSPPSDLNVPRANILMLGPAGAGKSSFVKTINCIFQERITQPTTTGSATDSLTMRYRHFLVRKLNNTPLNFCLSDTRGLQSRGAPDLADLNYLLEGNIPDGYIFTNSPVTSDVAGFKSQPAFQDKFHCVVFVFEASSFRSIDEGIWKKLNDLQIRMNAKDIPRIVLLTKIDKLSNDVSQVFLSKDVQKAVDFVSKKLSMPSANVMPIKNYENEMMLDNSISCLALQALDRMLDCATDYLMKKKDHK